MGSVQIRKGAWS